MIWWRLPPLVWDGEVLSFVESHHMSLEPTSLPDIPILHARAKALAMVEAIVSPEWEGRYYSFNASWCEGEEMASMRNGSGDDWFLLFGPFGAAIKGLAHETPLAGDKAFSAKVQNQVPKSFSTFLREPAFGMDRLSYCYWRSPEDSAWLRVSPPDSTTRNVDDGSEEFLALLLDPAYSYVEFAEWYYEKNLPLESVERIYRHERLTEELVTSLNPELAFAEAKAFAAEIGYPVGDNWVRPV